MQGRSESQGPASRLVRRRSVAWVLGGAAVLMCGCAAAYPWLSGRARPPLAAREGAIEALERARKGEAARWAPEMLAHTEATLAEAESELERQRDKFYLFRDFAEARSAFDLAADQAQRTRRDLSIAREEARTAAETALGRAESVLAETESLLDDVPLSRSERESLRNAKTELAMGRGLWRDEAFVEARDHAERAVTSARAAVAGAESMAARFTDSEQVRRWRRWIEETVRWSKKNKSPAIVVYKERNRLELYSNGRFVRAYDADMGSNNTRDKAFSGDRATPEGRYRITEKKDAGRSTYYKALLLDYPNEDDRRRFQELKRQGRIPRNASIGGLIEIHGEGGRGDDWTRGCVALSNADMDHLFARAPMGTPVTIVGGDGQNGRLSELARRLAQNNGASP